MKVLILSSNTGAGHNSAARAVQEVMMKRGVPCDIRDGLSFLSKDASKFISQWHSRLYRAAPRLYGEGYEYAQKHSQGMDEDSLVVRVLGLAAQSLRACILSQGYTHIVSTHLFPAMMLTRLQSHQPLPIVTSFISTDYTASPGYEAIDADWCFVPGPEIVAEFVRPGMPEEKIIGCGMPVSSAFLAEGDKTAAKRALGIDPEHRHLLVMSGSMGCGPLKKVISQLSAMAGADVDITVICGTNRKLSRQLNRLIGDRQNIHIHDFVDRVPLFMDSADLYLTKPGGLSVSEAMAKRLPMVLLQAVEGCETHNMHYCLKKGAAVTEKGPRETARLCVDLIHDTAALLDMRKAMTVPKSPSASEVVCDTLMGSEVRAVGI